MGKSLPCKQVLYSDYNQHAPCYILNRERSMFGLHTWLALSHCHLHRSKPSWVSEGICDDIHFVACECSFWCILNLISNIQTKPRRASLDKETERREKERQKEEGKIGVLRRREREQKPVYVETVLTKFRHSLSSRKHRLRTQSRTASKWGQSLQNIRALFTRGF